jgi:anti-anti-sigma factor
MKISIDKSEQYAIFEVATDKLVQANCTKVKSELVVLQAEGFRNIIFDARNIESLDADGAEVLLVLHRLCTEADGIFIFVNASDSVDQFLRMAQLHDVLNQLPTVAESIDAVFLSEIEAQLKLEDPGNA